jgi:hypothetical protein
MMPPLLTVDELLPLIEARADARLPDLIAAYEDGLRQPRPPASHQRRQVDTCGGDARASRIGPDRRGRAARRWLD